MSEHNDTFTGLGLVEAVSRLYEGTGYTPFTASRFGSRSGASCTSVSRVLLEGIDFDLTYFPLKHLGYKSVIAVTGELYASFAHPRTLNLTLGISAKLDFVQIRELWNGAPPAFQRSVRPTVRINPLSSIRMAQMGRRWIRLSIRRPITYWSQTRRGKALMIAVPALYWPMIRLEIRKVLKQKP